MEDQVEDPKPKKTVIPSLKLPTKSDRSVEKSKEKKGPLDGLLRKSTGNWGREWAPSPALVPITQGKVNVLYILHFHLNEEANRAVVPLVGELVGRIKPYLSGQRLLKLLSSSFTDLRHY
ncbi:unnamed protein product [Sphagnum balticum]